MDDFVIEEISRTLTIESDAISKLSSSLDMQIMEEIVKTIANSKGKVLISGCGTSAMAGKKIAHSLCCIECPASFLTPSDAVHGALGLLQENDVFILISKGGNTNELTQMISACKTKKATLICVSENETSILAKEADIFLKIKVDSEPCRFNMLATASTLAVISAFDAICIALMKYTNYTKEQFAIIHPKGAVGDRLLGKEDK